MFSRRPKCVRKLQQKTQVIEATATVKYAVRPGEAGRIYRTIAGNDREIYPSIIQPSLLKALKSVFSQYELVTIATEWNDISALVERTVADELDKFDYVEVRGLDLTACRLLRSTAPPSSRSRCGTAAVESANRGQNRRTGGSPIRNPQSQPR